MKITNVEAIELKNPLPPMEVGGGVELPVDLSSTVVRVKTDEGIEGVGESWMSHSADSPLREHILKQFRPLLIGENPLDTTRLWYKMWGALYRTGGFARGVAALDMALWDIKGKYFGVPLYQMLGGKAQPGLLAYATSPVVRDDLNVLTADVERFHKLGFKVAKVVVGRGLDVDKELVSHLVSTVGSKVRWAMDANGGYTFNEALNMAKWAEQYEPLWFEEPLPWYDIYGLAELTARTTVVTSGFQEESTFWRAQEYIRHNALRGFNVTLEVAGGVTCGVRINHLLESAHKMLIPHGFGPAIAYAATLHVAITHPHCGPIEYPIPDREGDPRAWITGRHIRNRAAMAIDQDGYVRPPEGPGLGIELDEDALENLRVR